jgi:hypothetical protein
MRFFNVYSDDSSLSGDMKEKGFKTFREIKKGVIFAPAFRQIA